jgi:hypothetical protein
VRTPRREGARAVEVGCKDGGVREAEGDAEGDEEAESGVRDVREDNSPGGDRETGCVGGKVWAGALKIL